MTAENVRQLREQATSLRRIADAVTAQADVMERGMSALPIMRPREISDLALVILLFEGGAGMHYRDLFAKVEAQSAGRVRGLDPEATFLATIARDPRIVHTGAPRSGMYTAAEGASV